MLVPAIFAPKSAMLKQPSDAHVAAYIRAPAARATGAPISAANPKVRVSVIWLPERNPLRVLSPRARASTT